MKTAQKRAILCILTSLVSLLHSIITMVEELRDIVQEIDEDPAPAVPTHQSDTILGKHSRDEDSEATGVGLATKKGRKITTEDDFKDPQKFFEKVCAASKTCEHSKGLVHDAHKQIVKDGDALQYLKDIDAKKGVHGFINIDNLSPIMRIMLNAKYEVTFTSCCLFATGQTLSFKTAFPYQFEENDEESGEASEEQSGEESGEESD